MSDELFAHYGRWNVEYNSDQQFEQFLFRVVRDVNKPYYIYLNEEEYETFTYLLGRYPTLDQDNRLSAILEQGTTQKYFAHLLQLCLFSFEKSGNIADRDALLKVIHDAIVYSPALSFEVAKVGEKAIVYPKGAQLLDREVVNQSLAWLTGYPNALRPFQTALTQYMTGDITQRRNLLDNLRLAIEQLLKQILVNQKSFENQQGELNTWLAGKDVHGQVISLYNQVLFGTYRIYQNEAVKHAEDFKEHDIEFMIYLSANLMRLLLQLEHT